MLRFKILPRFVIAIFLSFMLFTVIGTLSHEWGHIAVANYFGYTTTLSYGSMGYTQDFSEDLEVQEIKRLSDPYDDLDYDEWPADVKIKLEALDKIVMERYPYNETYKLHDKLITLGGPAQTLLTSGIGILLLFLRRKKWRVKFMTLDWLAVFMALFALREVFNFILASYEALFYSQSNFHGDEFKISRDLGFNEWMIPTLALVIGLLISCYVIFKIIPLSYRFSFILAGGLGSVAGYAMWFGFLGLAVFNW